MRGTFTIVLILCVLVQPMELSAGPADGTRVSQPAPGADTWDKLPRLPSGARVRLVLTDGSEVVGHLVSARAEAVVLERNKVRKGPFTAPTGMSLRDHLTFQRSDVVSAAEAKGWPLWAKVLFWVGLAWVLAGAIIGPILGNS